MVDDYENYAELSDLVKTDGNIFYLNHLPCFLHFKEAESEHKKLKKSEENGEDGGEEEEEVEGEDEDEGDEDEVPEGEEDLDEEAEGTSSLDWY